MLFRLEKLEVDNPVERLELVAGHEITEWHMQCWQRAQIERENLKYLTEKEP